MNIKYFYENNKFFIQIFYLIKFKMLEIFLDHYHSSPLQIFISCKTCDQFEQGVLSTVISDKNYFKFILLNMLLFSKIMYSSFTLNFYLKIQSQPKN
jgi:hypothetical protein